MTDSSFLSYQLPISVADPFLPSLQWMAEAGSKRKWEESDSFPEPSGTPGWDVKVSFWAGAAGSRMGRVDTDI